MENKDIIKMGKETSQKILNDGQRIIPMCLVNHKDGKVGIIALPMGSPEQKGITRQVLFKFILNQEIEKYALIMDTKMTSADGKAENPYEKAKVKDVIIINIYSPKEKEMIGFEYGEDKQIKDKPVFKIKGRKDKMMDMWDLWGNQEDISPEVNDKYQKFKKENPDKFKGV